MKKSVKTEIEKLIKELNLKCNVTEFKDKVNWNYISWSQKLSEKFISEFKDKVNWNYISSYQKLSEKFITEFKDKVDWYCISLYQKLSEKFITEFKDKVDWYCISLSQKLSEEFITEFKDKVYWNYISSYQKLSEEFISEFKDKVNIKLYSQVNEEKTIKQKTEEIKKYAKKYNLKFDGKYLYAFREHDQFKRGMFNKTISYESGKYYRDWHCDMRKTEENSFGLGIWPKGNTPVKVKLEDWGTAVNRNDGKARVWGLEII